MLARKNWSDSHRLGISSAWEEESPGPKPQKSEKSLEKILGPSSPKSQKKVPGRVRKVSKKSENVFFGLFFLMLNLHYPDLFSRVLFFPFCPLCGPPFFLPFSRHPFAVFFPLKNALFCRAMGTAQSLERGSSRPDLSTKFGKESPSRNLRANRSGSKRKGFPLRMLACKNWSDFHRPLNGPFFFEGPFYTMA